MTTPTLSDKLGDFFSVQLGSKLPVPVINGIPGQQVTLANQDLLNNVTISRNNSVSGGAIIPPLGSVTVDMSKTIWGTAPTGTLPLLVFPGGGSWAPSPAQVAAQINALGLAKDTTLQGTNTRVDNTNLSVIAQTSGGTIANEVAATGVPLLNLRNALQNIGTQTITAGSTFTPALITGITQPSYNMHITATAGGSSTKPWYTVLIKWIDSSTGFTVQVDSYTALMSSTSGALSTVISGPTDADQCQITVTNNDTVSMTLNQLFMFMSSRPNYTTDYFYSFWTSATMPPIPTFQIGAAINVPTSKVLFSVNRSLGNGLTTTPDYILPCYSGQVFISFKGTSSNNWSLSLFDQFTSTQIAPALLVSGNVDKTLAIFPRAPISLNIANNGTVSGTINLEITAL